MAKIKTSVSLAEDVLKELKQHARRNDRTISYYAELAINKFMAVLRKGRK